MCNWLHFQSILPISIPPSHPPLNRAALQVSVGLWYLFMINEGEKKKKMQMPPTDAMRDKSESERRKEGREEGRQRPTALPWSLCTARQPSIITHLRTNTPASTHSAAHKGVQKRKTYAQDHVKRSNSKTFQSNTRRCLYNDEKKRTLNAMDVSAGASGRAFPNAVF